MNKKVLTIVGVFILIASLIGCNQAKTTVNYEKIDKLKAEATAQKREELEKVQKEADDLQTKWAETFNKANHLLTDNSTEVGTEKYHNVLQEIKKLQADADRYYSEYLKKEKEASRLEQDIQQIEMKIEAENK